MYQEIFFDLLSKFKKRKLLIQVIILSVNENKKNPTFIDYFCLKGVGEGCYIVRPTKKNISSLNYLIQLPRY